MVKNLPPPRPIRSKIEAMSLDERSFFTDRNETRPARYACPRCNRTNEYSVRWVRRVKKDRLPPGADERDRAKFAKLKDHLIRVDDEVVCKTCGKKFDIPSMHSLLFVDQIEGLPKDEDEEGNAEPGPAPASDKPAAERRLPPRFSTPSRGWKG
jgi:transcription elongation factor Elf1